MSSVNNYDYPVARLLGTSSPKGEIGLEIEVEGRDLPGVVNMRGEMPVALGAPWRMVADGSLRNLNEGDQAIEYVLARPVSRTDLVKALGLFSDKWAEAGASSYNTYRTSVHVHLNMTTWPIRRVWSFLTAYFILEEALVDFADGGTKSRIGNRFCLRAVDSETIITSLSSIGRNQFRSVSFNTRDLKYGACNIAALQSYGSLEFRALRGTVDTGLIKRWTDMLLSIKDYASKFDNPTEIIQEFSELSPMVWAERVLGPDALRLLNGSTANMDQQMVYGVRLAQDVAYSCDWQPYVPFDETKKIKLRAPEEEADEEADDWGQGTTGPALTPFDGLLQRVAAQQAEVAANPAPRFRINVAGNVNYGVRI